VEVEAEAEEGSVGAGWLGWRGWGFVGFWHDELVREVYC
jgi:hypothetical protein